jgi:hypothetical protein
MNKALNALGFFGLIVAVVFSLSCLTYLRANSSNVARLQASVKASAHDARKLLDHDDAGIIALTESARHRLEQIEARAQ